MVNGAIFEDGFYVLKKGRIDLFLRMLFNIAMGRHEWLNDKPTGAVVGQQPFGGARGSGTNDKARAKVSLLRRVSLRTIKETFVPAVDYRYPFLERE